MNQTKLTITEKKLLKIFDRPRMRISIPRLESNRGKFPLLLNWPHAYEPRTIDQILAQGDNWGIRTGKQIGSYYFIIIDLDDIWAEARIQVPRYVKTAKGVHVYCLIKELPANFILVNKQKQRIGELHSLGKQVVGIGSIHWTGITYTLKLHGKNNAPWFLKFANLTELAQFLTKKGIFLKNGK